MNQEEFLRKMPKTELHLHLEGAIPIEAVFELVKKYDKLHQIKSIEEFRDRYKYKDFPEFIKIWYWQSQYIREYDDFTYIAEKTSEHFIEQNIKYVEASITPADFAKQHNLDVKKIVKAIRKGLDKNKKLVKVNLIYDFNRDLGADYAFKQLLEVFDVTKECGIIAVGLGGQEHLFPAKLFEKVFIEAKNLGLKTTMHAGEYAGSESIWKALDICQADRIGHCTSAIDDNDLIMYIKKKNIPIELCPISNVMTNVVKSIDEHPISKYYKMGLNVSINTDDPTMFNTSLYNEYTTLINKLKFSLLDIKHILAMTINSAFCDGSTKTQLHTDLNSFFQAHRQKI